MKDIADLAIRENALFGEWRVERALTDQFCAGCLRFGYLVQVAFEEHRADLDRCCRGEKWTDPRPRVIEADEQSDSASLPSAPAGVLGTFLATHFSLRGGDCKFCSTELVALMTEANGALINIARLLAAKPMNGL